MKTLSQKQRIFFWLLLTVFSTFFAEVTIGSAPMVFWKLDGWILTVSVYGLHILVLAPLIIRPDRKPAWQAIYLTGLIFGLYEAYITKILWNPTWNPDAFRVGGVAVFETLILVLFWHPVMAFLVPLVFTEVFLNLQPSILPTLNEKWKSILSSRKFMGFSGAGFGLILGSILSDPSMAMTVTILNPLLIFLLLWIWLRTAHNESFHWGDLLPGQTVWKILAVILLLDYIFLSFLLRPEALPPISSQVSIWFLYLIFGWLIIKARKRQPLANPVREEMITQSTNCKTPIFHWIIFTLLFSSTGVISSIFFAPLKDFAFVLVWAIGIPYGLALFFHSIRWVFSKQEN